MKKTLTVLTAAGVLLGAAACSAPTMSTEDTCARIQAFGEGSIPTSGSDKAGMIRFANQLRPIEATSPAELKAPLQSFIDFLDKSAKDPADSAAMQEAFGALGDTLGTVCAQ